MTIFWTILDPHPLFKFADFNQPWFSLSYKRKNLMKKPWIVEYSEYSLKMAEEVSNIEALVSSPSAPLSWSSCQAEISDKIRLGVIHIFDWKILILDHFLDHVNKQIRIKKYAKNKGRWPCILNLFQSWDLTNIWIEWYSEFQGFRS